MNKILYGVLYVVWYTLSLLPLCVHYVFSDIIYLILYKLVGYRIKVVRSNLQSSFPEKSEAELLHIERRFYHSLCDYFVETVKMMTMSQKEIRKRMVFKGTELVDECINNGQSCALYLGHLFNWEWISSIPLWITDKAYCGQLYHALENPTFDRLFLNFRQRWGAECIALTDILRTTIEYKQKHQPTIIGYIADQVPHWNNIHRWCQFLNHDTPVMTGAERIAVKNKQAFFYLHVRQIKRGYYEGTFQLMTHTSETLKEYEATDIYFRMLEENIRQQPELWLWSHNRWKRTREEFNERFEVIDGKVIEKALRS